MQIEVTKKEIHMLMSALGCVIDEYDTGIGAPWVTQHENLIAKLSEQSGIHPDEDEENVEED